MMRWIVGTSLRYRFLAVGAALVMMTLGAAQLRDTSVDVFPEFAPPRVEVQTACVGLSATEVEELITVPLEQNLQGVPGLDVMRSKSVEQLSSIQLIFEPGTDLMEARQLVQERVGTMAATLPSWAAPPVMIQPLSATSRVMKIGLSSDELSMIDLSMTAYWKIRARLLGVPGVANVAIWGQRKQMLYVNVDPERLHRSGVPLQQVMTATSEALDAGLLKYSTGTMVGTGGAVETPNQRLGMQHTLPIVTAEDLGRVTVGERPGGDSLRLQDVAALGGGHQPLSGDAVINDGEGLMLIVEKLPWANTLDVTRGVEATLAELEPGLHGIQVDSTIFRPATFIEIAIDNLTSALFIGAILVILILALFLFEWRSALISAVAIPLSLLGALIVLHYWGTTINTMVLAGLVIAVGVVVDDAIIDIENIVRRLRQNRQHRTMSTARVVLEASVEVRSAITYATLINVVAVVPVFFLEGLTGAFFRPLAIAYALAVSVSMVIALTVTPALAFLLLSRAPLKAQQPPLVRWLQAGYQRVLGRLMHGTRALTAGFAVVLLGGILAVPGLGQSLLPDFKERDFLMHWLGTPGTSHPEMVRITTQGSKELRRIEGVRNFGAHIGQAANADEVVGMYFAENWISVDPEVDYDETLARVQETVDGYPGLYRDVQTYLKERIREVLTGSSDAIVVRIYGDDLDQLRTTAEEVRAKMAAVDGTAEVHTELQVDEPQIGVEVDLVRAQEYGLKPGDVRRASAAVIGSEELGDLWTQGRVFDVRVWGLPELRGDVTDVRNMKISTPSGDQVRLADVASVDVAPTPNEIHHEDLSRYIEVTSNVRGDRDLGAVVSDIEDAVESVQFPQGYHPELLGEFAERQAAQSKLLTWSVVAALVILLLLQVALKSFKLALVAFLTLPAAMVGGVLAAYFTERVISLGSLVGFLTVLGIAARNGIMLISHYQHLEQAEGMPFGPALVVRGAKERLAPILMTALACALALLPLVAAGSIPGHEIEHPMAVVILGGLVTSTLLNLFAVPFLYLRFGGGQTPSGGEGQPQTATAM